jgi:hypothetical protein
LKPHVPIYPISWSLSVPLQAWHGTLTWLNTIGS